MIELLKNIPDSFFKIIYEKNYSFLFTGLMHSYSICTSHSKIRNSVDLISSTQVIKKENATKM